jgi:hypothetical protein
MVHSTAFFFNRAASSVSGDAQPPEFMRSINVRSVLDALSGRTIHVAGILLVCGFSSASGRRFDPDGDELAMVGDGWR